MFFFGIVQSGYLQHFQYFGSKDSIIPNYMYYLHNLHYGNGEFLF